MAAVENRATFSMRIGELRIVPVIAIDDAADAAPWATRWRPAGLPLAEVTFRTAAGRAVHPHARATAATCWSGRARC